MLLTLIRDSQYSTTQQTVGVLYIDHQLVCNTIEPPAGWATRSSDNAANRSSKEAPEQGKGCIPMGWYRVRVTQSPKFKRLLPLLEQVPFFSGIRIHAGSRVEHTKGCICVGSLSTEKQITETLLKAQDRHEEIYMDVTDRRRLAIELQKY